MIQRPRLAAAGTVRNSHHGLAVVLLLTLFGMHYLPSILALNYANQTAAAKAWQYINGGAGMAVVLACLGLLVRSAVVWPFVAWGIAEGLGQSVCRLAKPIGGAPPSAGPFDGLCGVDFYWLGVFAVLVLAISLLDKLRRQKS